MKKIIIAAQLLIVFLLTLSSCKKDTGFGGKSDIVGTVTYKGTPMSDAVVHLAFDATESTTSFNATTVTDANGNYSFAALNKGDYFVDAEYTNGLGITLESAGAIVNVGGKKGEVKVDLTVQ